MNFEEPTPADERAVKRYVIFGAVAGAILVLVMVMIYAGRTPQRPSTDPGIRETDKLDAARRDLAKTTDLATCRNAIQQINLYLTDHANRRPPALAAEQRAFLANQCIADPAEIAEVEGGAFTLLDAHHLAECFLFRDAAQSLGVNGRPAAQRADAAFRWTVRQVRLREPILAESDWIPPEFVLRRGWGTPGERALVFLAMLRQLGVEGCLIASPAGEGGRSLYWACGALTEAKDKEGAGKPEILLFDPRLGIPLPGPNGEGIAALAGLREHPDDLKALTVDPELPYDVTAAQVAGAEIHLIEPLSALSPRMAALQKDLLGPGIKGRLTADPKESLDRFGEAAKPLNVPVKVATRWTGALRRFLPPDEGGSDHPFSFPLRSLPGFLSRNADNLGAQMTRKRLFAMELAPWTDFPARLVDLPWSSELGQRPRNIFNQFFVSLAIDPRSPRDLVLRGQSDEAVAMLGQMRDTYDNKKKRLMQAKDRDLDEQINAWVKRAFEVFGDLARAEQKGASGEGPDPGVIADAKQRVEALWKDGAQPLGILIEGEAARPLNVETTYLLALALQEQALRIQDRIDHDREAGRTENVSDVDAARSAWQTTLSWWRTLAMDPAAAQYATAARRWQAQAHLALGDRAAARALLQDVSGNLTPLEKTAHLYLASRIKP